MNPIKKRLFYPYTRNVAPCPLVVVLLSNSFITSIDGYYYYFFIWLICVLRYGRAKKIEFPPTTLHVGYKKRKNKIIFNVVFFFFSRHLRSLHMRMIRRCKCLQMMHSHTCSWYASFPRFMLIYGIILFNRFLVCMCVFFSFFITISFSFLHLSFIIQYVALSCASPLDHISYVCLLIYPILSQTLIRLQNLFSIRYRNTKFPYSQLTTTTTLAISIRFCFMNKYQNIPSNMCAMKIRS